MGLFDYIEKLLEQTENLNKRLYDVEIEIQKLKHDALHENDGVKQNGGNNNGK